MNYEISYMVVYTESDAVRKTDEIDLGKGWFIGFPIKKITNFSNHIWRLNSKTSQKDLTTNPKPQPIELLTGSTTSLNFDLSQNFEFSNITAFVKNTTVRIEEIENFEINDLEPGEDVHIEVIYSFDPIRILGIDFESTTDELIFSSKTSALMSTLVTSNVGQNQMTLSWEPIDAQTYHVTYCHTEDKCLEDQDLG